MPSHVSLQRGLPALRQTLFPSRVLFPPNAPQARFFNADYIQELRKRRIPWTITKEDLHRPQAELLEVVRDGIWAGQNGASRQTIDKRARNDRQQEAKRQKLENGEEVKNPVYATTFSQEDIEGEQRRPKKKVAVLLGYSGTGYKGMQLSETEKTIEGELFAAFVAAGAISKANATDPKKSSLVRCARTDKGVHAAGNIVSLKLIVEDEDIIQKINEKLSPQIRVWDILVANKSFSSYQLCDSRIYEYLIPTHCFLPPHPSTYLGKKLVEYAEKEGDLEAYKARQEEVTGHWEEIDEKYIRPILENAPEDIRKLVEKVLHLNDEDQSAQGDLFDKKDQPAEEAAQSTEQPSVEDKPAESDAAEEARRRQIFDTVKAVKAAYLKAKRAYRIPAARLARVQEALDKYVGTNNFFNYTIQKVHADPSSKRHIKSFKVAAEPIIINGTEWLSLKVHGQSFMMHQIRKMVAMAAMVVRCGCDPNRIVDTYRATKIAIPKAPGLGLLLERPVFDSYNKKTSETGKAKIDFDKHAATIAEFKQREIYDRIFREEEETHAFSAFFNHLDHYSQEEFLYVTSGGIPAAKLVDAPAATEEGKGKKSQREALAEVESGDEDEGALPNGGEEGG
ncbi:tRNA pseudouridine synthase [Aspergillus heteromorphus CBS 117.55]|uniref:tRNA pseudouridine synthase 1 n=1 Tax=Aspergillus heteromorphus CBS 117.55 TaxID=1448321 RepID=A0A317V7X0_9EURO|nr:tRNA pseudouridine synthase [Aspergillus heteromorphus CBS 117.55]PWY70463.1 tRNA pseudouridine synthase [Aspergillus heteromorphus CBS 117.55]